MSQVVALSATERYLKLGSALEGLKLMHINDRRIRFLFKSWSCGSMRAAAEVMNTAPSSVSRQIAALESEVGTELIERGCRDIRLTEAGSVLVDYYRARVARVNELEEQLHALVVARRGTLKVALGEGFLSDAMCLVVDQFAQKYPLVDLEISTTDTVDMVKRILQDEVHLGVGFHPQPESDLISRFRISAPLVAAMPPFHPLANLTEVTLTQLACERLALMNRDFRITQMILQAANKENIHIAPSISSNSVSFLTRIVCLTKAATILPKICVREQLKDGKLIALPIRSNKLTTLNTHILSRKGRNPPKFVDTFGELLKQNILDVHSGAY